MKKFCNTTNNDYCPNIRSFWVRCKNFIVFTNMKKLIDNNYEKI